MKIYILLLILVLSLSAVQIDEFAVEVNYSREYRSALDLAKKEKKILMILVVADYCPWCKKFERKTLKNIEVKKRVNEEFIALAIDKFKDKGTFPDKFASPVIPTVYFVNPKTQKEILSTVGYMKRKEFLLEMDKALELFKVRN